MGTSRALWVAIAAVATLALVAAPALAIKPKPTKCNANTRTVRFESIDTFRDTISASGDAGSVTVKARGGSEDDGYARKDVCDADPGKSWRMVVLSGDDGADEISARGLDAGLLAKLNGGGTLDEITGHGGRDEIRGGASQDDLIGLGGDDLLIGGDSDDAIDAGPGNDVIRVRDGNSRGDRVDCGPGHDVVFTDRDDEVEGCEKVHR